MTEYLKGKENKDYDYDPEVVSANYCKSSGKLAGLSCGNTATGYYSPSNMPEICTGHTSGRRIIQEKIPLPSGEASESSGESSSTETQDSESSGETETAVDILTDDD